MNTRTFLAIFLFAKTTSTTNLETCVAKILNKYVTRSCVYYFSDKTDVDFHNNTNLSWILFNEEGDIKGIESVRFKGCYILLIEKADLPLLQNRLSLIYHTRSFNTSSVFIIITRGLDDDPSHLFELLWEVNILNAVIIDGYYNVFTYYPISKGNCSVIRAEFVFNCLGNTDYTLFTESKLTLMTGCPIRYLQIPVKPYVGDGDFDTNTGYSVVVLRELSRMRGLVPIKISHTYNSSAVKLPNGSVYNMYHKLPNGSYSGLFKMIYDREADIILGPLVVVYVEDFYLTYPHLFTKIAFFVSTAKPFPAWMNITKIFTSTVWLGIALSVILITPVWHLIEGIGVSESFFYVITGLLAPNSSLPTTDKSRFLYLVWIIFAFIIISSFQTLLISYMYRPIYEKQISTAEDLVEADQKLYSIKSSSDAINTLDNPHVRTLYSKLENVLALGDKNWKDVVDGNSAIATTTAIGGIALAKYKPGAVRILTSTYDLSVTNALKKGSPFINVIDAQIIRFLEHGFLVKWKPFETYNVPISYESKFEVIDMYHMLLSFCIYVGGVTLAILIFIAEMLCWSYSRSSIDYLV